MSRIKYIFFDAANTLIHKPSLWQNYLKVLKEFGYEIQEKDLKVKHKILSECIDFPDITSKQFYDEFNMQLINALGIVHTQTMIDEVFESCKYLPWEVFEDIHYLETLNQYDLGICSNFNSGLRPLVKDLMPNIAFKHIIISEDVGVAKPELEFYKIALKETGLKANEILYIGDSIKLDIIPALEVGFNVKLIDREGVYLNAKSRIESLKNIV